MSRPIVLGVAAVLLFAFGVIAANTHIATALIPVTAYEADVNKDAHVNSGDMLHVAQKFGQPVPTATAGPSAPSIVGNRAFGQNYGGDVPYQLFNTDDGSLVKTFAVGDAPVSGPPASCDGKYSMLSTPVQFGEVGYRIIRTVDGSIILEDLVGYGVPTVEFTCPLKGLGAQFSNGGPVANRAVVQAFEGPSGWNLRIYDLTTGQPLYAQTHTAGSFSLSCAQSTVAIGNDVGSALTLVRLSDGGVVATIPAGGGFRQAC